MDRCDCYYGDTDWCETCGEWIADCPCWQERQARMKTGNENGICTDCGLPVWWQDSQLVTRDGIRWCYGPGRTRIAMERHHALPGMAQYVVRAREGQVCHCLDRAKAHIHKIIEVDDDIPTR